MKARVILIETDQASHTGINRETALMNYGKATVILP